MQFTHIPERLNLIVPDLHADFSVQKENINKFIKEQREILKTLINDKNVGGCEICRYNSTIFDAVVKKIFDIAVATVGVEPNIAIFAAGGYGREELCYFSDIDLCYTSEVNLEEVYDEDALRFISICYEFIDALSAPGKSRLRTSFLYRPYSYVNRWNYQDITAILDARFLAGNADLMEGLRKTITQHRDNIPITLKLLSSREEHFKKTGDTIYLNQPDMKSGKGGLREIQFALWIEGLKNFVGIKVLYEKIQDEQLTEAVDFMLKVRNLLHLLKGKHDDVLSYNPENGDVTQLAIAKAMGYSGDDDEIIYALMDDYYRHAKYLHLKSELLIGKSVETGMKISEHLIVKRAKIYCTDNQFEQLTQDELITTFEYFQQYDFEIDAELDAYLASNHQRFDDDNLRKRVSHLFSLRGYASKALRRMHRLGLIEHFLPDFERAMRTRSERATDPFTVGKHMLEAVAHLDEIRNAKEQETPDFRKGERTEIEYLNDIYLQISDSSVIYFALLMHDFAKPSPNHAQIGAQRIGKIAQRLGFNQTQIEEITFLVREHLSMIEIARYLTPSDSIIDQFKNTVGSLERLMKLYLLTYCDSKANGAHNFTALEKDNLKDAYERTRKLFVGKDKSEFYAMVSPERLNRFFSQMPITYRMVHSNLNEISFHIRFVEQIEKALAQNQTDVVVQFVDKRGYTELHFCCPDRVGLINQIAGVFYAHQTDVREAHIYTKVDTSVALDVFKLVYRPSVLREMQPEPISEELKSEIRRDISNLIKGRTTLEEILATQNATLPSNFAIDEIKVESSKDKNYSEIIVKAKEQIGFLYLFSGILTSLGLNIEMSKCSSLGNTLTNRFYVQPIQNPEEIRAKITDSVGRGA